MRLSGGEQLELARILTYGGLYMGELFLSTEEWVASEGCTLSAVEDASQGQSIEMELYHSIDSLLHIARNYGGSK